MKSKIVFGVLALLLIITTVLLFIPENKAFKIISSPKIHSIYKSSDNELFKIEFLVNSIDTYYFDDEFIAHISLKSDLDEEEVSLVLMEVEYQDNVYLYDNNEFFLVELSLGIGFNSDDYLIEYKDAYIKIEYKNEENVTLYIGEFNYLFNENINDELLISNLSSTVFKYNDVSTVGGVFIELHNNSEENLVIRDFRIGSSSLIFNNYYLSEIYSIPDLYDSVEDVILHDEFNFELFVNNFEKSILVRKNHNIMLYVPISYTGEINFIHRFYFEIDYISNEGENSLIIDDFPYISTSPFQESLEDGYIIYEILN